MNQQSREIVTMRRVLFGERRDADATHEALERFGVPAMIAAGLVGVSPYAQRFAQGEVERVIDGLLDMDAPHAIAQAWSKHRQLEAARRRTLTTRGRELIELAVHEVSSNHPVHIDVVVDNVPRQRVDAELALRVRLQGVVATVASGEVESITGGDVELRGTLTVLGVTVVERPHQIRVAALLAESVESRTTV